MCMWWREGADSGELCTPTGTLSGLAPPGAGVTSSDTTPR
jgi:hypothetical protein